MDMDGLSGKNEEILRTLEDKNKRRVGDLSGGGGRGGRGWASNIELICNNEKSGCSVLSEN